MSAIAGSDGCRAAGESLGRVVARREEHHEAQIGLARELGLSVVFHNRNATEDLLRVLREESSGDLTGAAHYFQGDWEYASSLLDMGYYISFAKPL